MSNCRLQLFSFFIAVLLFTGCANPEMEMQTDYNFYNTLDYWSPGADKGNDDYQWSSAHYYDDTLSTNSSSEDLGNGFTDHGVGAPVSNPQGIVATVNGKGENVVLVWLRDHRGGYGILMINAETGESQTFPVPFVPSRSPAASVLSSDNKYYTQFDDYFLEFDPEEPGFTFQHETHAGPRAMSMTEDDQGRIWAVTYPNNGIMSYNPETGAFNDYGFVHDEAWRQYQRNIAADDTGWIYFGVGNAHSHIIGFNPDTEESKLMMPEDVRLPGERGMVRRATNGKCYGHIRNSNRWFRLYNGEATELDDKPDEWGMEKEIIAGTQNLFHQQFPDGQRAEQVDLIERVLVVKNPETDETRRVAFDYESEGPRLTGIATTPNGTISGGTAHPMRFFSYDPDTDRWVRRNAYGQWNTLAATEDRLFVGGYTKGFLLEWDPTEPWVSTEKGNQDSNPRWLVSGGQSTYRPHDLLVHPNGELVVLAGTPGYGHTGGGLIFWERESEDATIIEDEQILMNHSTASLVSLPNGKLLGGSTTRPGSGGERKVKEAEMYIMDIASKEVEWHEPLLPEAQRYLDMIRVNSGMVYGFVDRERFFVFDPVSRQIVHEQNTGEEFGPTIIQQGPRIFVEGPDGITFVLFQEGIAKVDPDSYEIEMLAEAPIPIKWGGDFLNGRIYFGHGSHLYSWEISQPSPFEPGSLEGQTNGGGEKQQLSPHSRLQNPFRRATMGVTRRVKKPILYSEDFEGYANGVFPSDWWVEGCEAVFVQNKRLLVKADPDKERRPGYGCTVWNKERFSGDVQVEFDAHVVASSIKANNINFFLHYTHPGADSTIYGTRNFRFNGMYPHYHELNGYIFTFLNTRRTEEDEARFRMRRCPEFELIDENFAYHNRVGETYHVTITKQGNNLTYAVDGREYLRATDDKYNWEEGVMGFRTFHTDLWFDNFKVTRPKDG